jgi:hypothetical protein
MKLIQSTKIFFFVEKTKGRQEASYEERRKKRTKEGQCWFPCAERTREKKKFKRISESREGQRGEAERGERRESYTLPVHTHTHITPCLPLVCGMNQAAFLAILAEA